MRPPPPPVRPCIKKVPTKPSQLFPGGEGRCAKKAPSRPRFRKGHWKGKCGENGETCYVASRWDLALFSSVLPGLIAFTDVDGEVEINRSYLRIETKSRKQWTGGQELAFRNWTKDCRRSLLVQFVGDAKTETITDMRVCRKGVWGPWEETTTEQALERIRKWAEAALKRVHRGD
jgi:hypothetical protein